MNGFNQGPELIWVVLWWCLILHPDVIKLQLVEAGLVECLLEVVTKTVDGESEEDVVQLKTASDLMVLLLLGGEFRERGFHY